MNAKIHPGKDTRRQQQARFNTMIGTVIKPILATINGFAFRRLVNYKLWPQLAHKAAPKSKTPAEIKAEKDHLEEQRQW
jgi:hypothetical protein